MHLCDWAILETTNEANVRECERKWVKIFLDSGCEVLNLDKECRYPGRLRMSPAHKNKIGNALRGRVLTPLSDVVRELISLSLKGRKITWGDKISAAKMGHIVTEGTRLKLRKPLSEETKQKISVSKLGSIPWNKGIRRGA